MEKSPLLKETIFEILHGDLPPADVIPFLTFDEKTKIESQQQQILELFQDKVLQIIDSYQQKLNSMLHEITIEQANPTTKQKPSKLEGQDDFERFKLDTLSDRQLQERFSQVRKQLKAMKAVISKKPKRKAWK